MAKKSAEPNLAILFVDLRGIEKIITEGRYNEAEAEVRALFEPLHKAAVAGGGALLGMRKEIIFALFGFGALSPTALTGALMAGKEVLALLDRPRFRPLKPAVYLQTYRVNTTHVKKDFSNLESVIPRFADALRFAAQLPRSSKVLLAEEALAHLPPTVRCVHYKGGKKKLYMVKTFPRKLPGKLPRPPAGGPDPGDLVHRIMAPREAKEEGALSVLDLRLQKKGGKESAAAKKHWKVFLDRFSRSLGEMAARNGGEVLKRSKTQAVLVFRGHSPLSRTARTAVRTALSICTDAAQALLQHGVRVRVATAIASAQGTFGSLKSRGSKAEKACVKRVSGLITLALPGHTVIDAQTRTLLRGAYTIMPGRDSRHYMLGDLNPLRLVEKESVEAEPPTVVGRPAEMGQIRRALSRVRESGAGTVFSLQGDEGMGKTMLARTAVYLASDAGVSAHYGSCDPDRLWGAFLPVKEVLTSMIGLNTFGEPEVELDKLGEWLIQRVPVHADFIHKAFRLLFHLPGLPNPVEDYVPRLKLGIITKSILTYIEAEAQRTPLLLIFDNLHLAVKDTLDLIARIEDLTRTAPVIVMKTSSGAVNIPLGRGEVRVKMKKLSQNHVLRLAKNVLGAREIGPGLRAYLLDKFKGMPGRICEALEELRENRRITATRNRWDFAQKKDRNPKLNPRELRRKRLGGLSKAELRVLEYAAFLGRHFSRKALRALAGSSDATNAALGNLSTRNFLIEMRIRGALEYAFPDRLMRQVLLSRVKSAEAKRMHGRAAAAIRKSHDSRLGEHIDRVVWNLRDAGKKKELGEFLIHGAVTAKGTGMSGLAEEYFTEALALFKDDRVYDAWIRFELSGLLCQTGRTDAALDMLKDALGKLGKSTEIPDFDERFGEDFESDEEGESDEEDEDRSDSRAGL
jgi:class 3 adenylate cyclase